jgi:uncharacterized coiled-coil protein SlyX
LQEKITTINESTENNNMDERPPHY